MASSYQPRKGDRVIFINEPGEGTTIPAIDDINGPIAAVVLVAHKNGQSTIMLKGRVSLDLTRQITTMSAWENRRIGNDDLAPFNV